MSSKFISLFIVLLVMLNVSFAQTQVSTGILKHPLLEEGTGSWCGYCPQGAQIIQQNIEPSYPRAICVAFHNNDPLELPGDPFNSVYIPGFPSAAIDRQVWNHITGNSVDVNRAYWITDVQKQHLMVTPVFQVDMLGYYDSATRKVDITVTGKALAALSGQYRINAYIAEDSIPATTGLYRQHSFFYDDTTSWWYNMCSGPCFSNSACINCALLPDSAYAHMAVVRHILGGSIFGDSAFNNPAMNATASKTYSYTIPAASPAKYIKVVGFVTKYGAQVNDRRVENAIMARVRLMGKNPTASIAAMKGITELQLFPNPAVNDISFSAGVNASSETNVVITNTVGQTVAKQHYEAGAATISDHVSLQDVPAGVYLFTISNRTAKQSKSFVIAK